MVSQPMNTPTNDMRFDDRVVIVTGAGNGLGRSHALLFAAHGARVVVNDLGGTFTGEGSGTRAADAVVDEIKAAGGEAIANYDSVTDGEKIVQTALDTWGRVDVVVNNAGILRDVSFHKMTQEDWDKVYAVHVLGSMKVTHAAWPHMREQRYGRVIMTSSAAGIYGNFGQANYSMAKLGLHGFSNALSIEGLQRNIYVNTIAPIAGSRMTETVLPPAMIEALKPEYVSPLVVWLCHESCAQTGGLFEVGGGFMGQLRWQRAKGKIWRVGRTVSPGQVRDGFDAITSFDDVEYPSNVTESMLPIINNIEAGPSQGGNEFIDVDAALGYEYPEQTSSYDERDLALYALGVGAAKEPYGKDLQLVYELHGDGFRALPSFGVIPAINFMLGLAQKGITAPGTNFGIERTLHGEQYTKIERPLPPQATLTHRAKITDILDKGKGAVVVTEIRSYDETGDLLLTNEFRAFVIGAGGWGGKRGETIERNVPPNRPPDFVVEEPTSENQGLLYRLSGDWNPLHADPSIAKAMNFDRPILHGLCTFGFATRHVLANCAPDGDVRFFESIDVRFSRSVYPGDTLVTEMWKDGRKVIFQTKVKERDEVVLSNCAITLYERIPQPTSKPKTPDSNRESTEASASSGPSSADFFTALGLWMKDAGEDAKVGSVYQFRTTNPDSTWTVDAVDGTVSPGETKKPDCTLTMTDENFVAMCKGEKDAQKMYFSGDLKISGDVLASQKLTFLSNITPQYVERAMATDTTSAAAVAVGAPPEATAEPVAPALFGRIKAKADHGRRMLFKVLEPDSVWLVDFAAGEVRTGAEEPADTTITLTDDALARLVSGQASEAQLYQRGELRVDGDMTLARDLSWMKEN